MLIQNSIVAGEILNILDNAKRAVSYDELKYYIEKPMHYIQVGVERLIREGLVVFEIEDDTLKVKSIPEVIKQTPLKTKCSKQSFAYA